MKKPAIKLKWEMQKVLRHEKGDPNLFIIVEMQIITTVNFHFLPVRLSTI